MDRLCWPARKPAPYLVDGWSDGRTDSMQQCALAGWRLRGSRCAPFSHTLSLSAHQATALAQEQQTESMYVVLVVDDEEGVRLVAKRMLERIGYSVLTAGDGNEGATIVRAHTGTIACVLLDLSMPHMSGEQTFYLLRTIKPDLRAVLMSGYTREEMIARFSESGIDDFLHKPFTMGELRQVIQHVISS